MPQTSRGFIPIEDIRQVLDEAFDTKALGYKGSLCHTLLRDTGTAWAAGELAVWYELDDEEALELAQKIGWY